jgi:hypothetical protein
MGGTTMDNDSSVELVIKNGVVSILLRLPGTHEPQVLRRVTDLRQQIILIGDVKDTTAPTDLRTVEPDLLLQLPRPVSHIFGTEQLGEVVIVVGPNDVLKNDELAERYAAQPTNILTVSQKYFILTLQMTHELHVISGLPGQGRKALAINRLQRLEKMIGPGQMSIIKTVTNRELDSLADRLFFEGVSTEEFSAREAAGRLIQVAKYGQVSYGIDREQALATLQRGDGICILVEARIDELMELGFPVYVTEAQTPINSFVPPPDRN